MFCRHPGGRAARSALELPLRVRPPGLVIILHTASPSAPRRRATSSSSGWPRTTTTTSRARLHAGRRLAAVRGSRLAGPRRLQRLRVQRQEPRRRVPGQLRARPAEARAVGGSGGVSGSGHGEGTEPRPDYKLLGHRQVSSTESPGRHLYEAIKKLKHWSPVP
uniref:Uncharacterized protein n=1 Tax=Trichogramma kaykai TaxID=54128 RepID=A0ABD2WL18_9HYME